MKNVNDVDFDTNMLIDMCMKAMFILIDIKLLIAYTYIHTYIMRIVIYVIYVHDDVYVYEYVNGYDI